LFVPSWSAQDKVAAYAVFGHMPYYLAQIREEASLADNILALVLRPDGLLHEEARLLLDQELHDASAYFSVLRAIAAGQTRVSQIAQRTAIPGGTSRVSQMLELLRKLWLVDRERPVTVTNPERSRQSFYRITDPYLRFWFRFVLPAQGRLADEEGASRHLHSRVLPQLDDFVAAPAFEELCQQWLRRTLDAAAVGWWWARCASFAGRRCAASIASSTPSRSTTTAASSRSPVASGPLSRWASQRSIPRVGTATTSGANGSPGARSSSAPSASTRPSARSARWAWSTR
jgi:hypothetical protein